MAEQGGTFRRKRSNFSQVSNIALTDPKLSLRAKGLYAVIQRYLTLAEFSDYKVYKTTIQANCSEGRSAFNAAWNELKDAGFLKIYKQTTHRGYIYEYELLDEPEKDTDPEESNEIPRGRFSTPWESDAWNPDAGNPTAWKPSSLDKKEEKNIEISKKELNNNHSSEVTKKLLNIDEIYDSQFEGHRDAEFELRAYLNTLVNTANIDRMKEDITSSIESGINSTPYTFNDYVLFAADQVSLPNTFWFVDRNVEANPKKTYKTALEWVKAMASVYSNENETLYIGKTQVKTINFKQRLLQIDSSTFENVLVKFSEAREKTNITNISGYMMQMLYNGSFDSGSNFLGY